MAGSLDSTQQNTFLCSGSLACSSSVVKNPVIAISPGPSFYYYGCYNCTDSTVQYLIHSIKAVSGTANEVTTPPLLYATNGKLICFHEYPNINKTNENNSSALVPDNLDIFYLQSAIYVTHKRGA
jgi:uncharacterized CHY-type Zn-finger protein